MDINCSNPTVFPLIYGKLKKFQKKNYEINHGGGWTKKGPGRGEKQAKQRKDQEKNGTFTKFQVENS